MPEVHLPQQKWSRGSSDDLHLAAQDGSIHRTVALLSRGSSGINRRSPKGNTALMISADNGHSSIVRILLNKGADTSIVCGGECGYTALHLAARNGHLDVSEMLIKAGAEFDATASEGFTPLHLAALRGHMEVMRDLLKAGADLQAPSSLKFTPLHLAVQERHLQIIQELVKAGADLLAKTSDGFTPLHLSVEMKHLEGVTTLLQAGASFKVTTSAGYTPLHVAAQVGHEEILTAMVKAGADLQATVNEGYTPIHLAAQYGHLDVMEALLEAGAQVQATIFNGFTPLHLAAQRGYLEVGTVLVKAGAGPNAMSSRGVTPLHLAAENGHMKSAAALMEAGAHLEATIAEGHTPLHVAARMGHSKIVTALIDAGAKCDHVLPGGATPLALAATGGYFDAVRVLLRAQASPLLTWIDDESGQALVPLDAAARGGHVDIVHELVQELWIGGCGGASGGVDALRLAAQEQHADITVMLINAGVVDTGEALIVAAREGRETTVRFLLQQTESNAVDRIAYVNSRDECGQTPLFGASASGRCSPRVVRLLVDAGGDTTSAGRVTDTPGGKVVYNETPLDVTNRGLRQKKVEGEDATKEQLHGMEGIRRLLLRVEAVHAVFWLWHIDALKISRTAESSRKGKITPIALRLVLPVLRRRTRRRTVLLRALFRYSSGLAVSSKEPVV